MNRKLNPYLVKQNRCYRLDEVADLFSCHRNTIHRWLKSGLETIDSNRPLLVHGSDLRSFIQARKKSRKRRCKPDEFYCMCCKEPRKPTQNSVEFMAQDSKTGRLTGDCNICGNRMVRFISRSKLSN